MYTLMLIMAYFTHKGSEILHKFSADITNPYMSKKCIHLCRNSTHIINSVKVKLVIEFLREKNIL